MDNKKNMNELRQEMNEFNNNLIQNSLSKADTVIARLDTIQSDLEGVKSLNDYFDELSIIYQQERYKQQQRQLQQLNALRELMCEPDDFDDDFVNKNPISKRIKK